MGLDVNGARFLLHAKRLHVDFTRTATIGRQALHLRPAHLKRNLRDFGLPCDTETVEQILNGRDGYADEFFRCLGAWDVESFDYSDYEGATHLHDLNEPIPDAFTQKYSLVLDGGSLEHVFNFPVALKSCLEMVALGGHFVCISPANNFMGHGFYQLSPELYFSVLTEENGYELLSMVAYEDKPKAQWYSVANPSSVKDRVRLTNSRKVSLAVIAKRVSVDVLRTTPQQCDYVAAWNQRRVDPPTAARSRIPGPARAFLRQVRRPVRAGAKRIARLALRLGRSGFSPSFFHPFDPTA